MKSKATGTISAVNRKAVSQGHTTLVFHLCGDGTSRAQKGNEGKVMIFIEQDLCLRELITMSY
jgi:hypothetical protein